MKPVPEITLAAMQVGLARMGSIGSNLANALTPAYQRQGVMLRPNTLPFSQQVSDMASQTPGVALFNDTRVGTLKPSGRPLDVALSGPGYFEVETPTGIAYTRAGNFEIDARGRLTTLGGHPVMGKGGVITMTTQSPQIDAQGTVRDGARVLGQLKVVRFEKADSMERLGEGLFSAGQNGQLVSDADIRIRQGMLENSNVSHVHEMVQLMQTLRHFESLQRVTQAYDEMLGVALRKFGEF